MELIPSLDSQPRKYALEDFTAFTLRLHNFTTEEHSIIQQMSYGNVTSFHW